MLQRILGTADGSQDGVQVMGLLIHGDAAFAGQGLVAELLQMSNVPGMWHQPRRRVRALMCHKELSGRWLLTGRTSAQSTKQNWLSQHMASASVRQNVLCSTAGGCSACVVLLL